MFLTKHCHNKLDVSLINKCSSIVYTYIHIYNETKWGKNMVDIKMLNKTDMIYKNRLNKTRLK